MKKPNGGKATQNARIPKPQSVKAKRTCGECAACCEGHLQGEVYGYPFYLGRPCHFMKQGGCSIYPYRPMEPCVNFNCVWLSEDILPAWFRPDKSNVIVTREKWGPDKSETYIKVTERGVKIDSAVLNLIYMYHVQTQTPISVQVDRGWSHYGPCEFVAEMKRNPA
jgi:hypothetical protein